MEAVGLHCVCELFDCPSELLNDREHIERSLREAVKKGDATLLKDISFKFEPQGVTALGLISESHLSIHTWPENGYAAVDAYTCGHEANAENAVRHMVKAMGAQRFLLRKMSRGLHNQNDPGVQSVDGSFQEVVDGIIVNDGSTVAAG